jgi:hypothetical protein
MLEFEKHGYFETLLDAETQKVVGNRTAKLRPGRKVGYEGKERITVIGDLPLQRGHKEIVVRCHAGRNFFTIIYPVCGRVKERT